MSKEIKKYIIVLPIILSIIGFVLLSFYIFKTSVDVIYSDYIRLTNSYIENVFDFSKMLTADILTRIPISYLFRMINVSLFSYSLMFDRVLSVLFLSLIFFIVVKYLIEHYARLFFVLFLFVICFALNQWELILNGSGYCHYFAYVLFIYYFYSVSTDVERNLNNDKSNNFIAFFAIIFVAGPYCATFVVTATLLNIYLKKYKNIPFIIIPFCMYLVSNHFAVYEHSGLQKIGLIECLSNDIFYPIRFLFKAIASSILGVESYDALLKNFDFNSHFIYIIAFFLLLVYLYIFVKLIFLVLTQKRGLFEISLLIMCIGNYLIVFLARYGFMNDSYGMQSRYYLQYMIGNIAVICYVSRFSVEKNHFDKKSESVIKKNSICKQIFLSYLLPLIIICPIVFTTRDEIIKMPARRASYENMLQIAYNIDDEKDEILPKAFEYNHSPALIRDAFNIIKSNNLNIYHKN